MPERAEPGIYRELTDWVATVEYLNSKGYPASVPPRMVPLLRQAGLAVWPTGAADDLAALRWPASVTRSSVVTAMARRAACDACQASTLVMERAVSACVPPVLVFRGWAVVGADGRAA